MRWRIYGSDAGSGDSVLLNVEAGSAAEAVTGAHDRQVVVASVVRADRDRFWRALPFVAVVLAITLGLAAAVLRYQLGDARRAMQESQREGQRILADLQGTRANLDLAQSQIKRLTAPGQGVAEIVQLRAQLAAALANAQTLNAMGKDAGARLAQLNLQLEDLRRQVTETEALRKTAQTRLDAARATGKVEEKKAAEALAAAASRSKQDASRVATLEGRLADLTARLKAAESNSTALRRDLDETRQATRRALAASYDDALAFAALEFGKPAFYAARNGITVSATQAERAITFIMHTDKERVFDLTVQVCLAPDAPRDVLTANQALLEKYAAKFAPRWQDAPKWLAKAIKQAGPGSGAGENERLVLVTDHYHLSLWCSRDAQYSLRIESASGE